MAKAPSRSARWFGAVQVGREAQEELQGVIETINEELQEAFQTLIDGFQEAIDKASEKLSPASEKAVNALQELKDLQEEYQEWYDNMPEQLQSGPTGEKLEEIGNFDFDVEIDTELEVPEIECPEVSIDLSDLEGILDEAESAELPMGFGRD